MHLKFLIENVIQTFAEVTHPKHVMLTSNNLINFYFLFSVLAALVPTSSSCDTVNSSLKKQTLELVAVHKSIDSACAKTTLSCLRCQKVRGKTAAHIHISVSWLAVITFWETLLISNMSRPLQGFAVSGSLNKTLLDLEAWTFWVPQFECQAEAIVWYTARGLISRT